MEQAAEHTSERAKDVAETAKSEVRDVVDEARDALRRQADEQSRAAAGAISRLRDDLRAMSDGEGPRDATADYLQRAARSLDEVAERLDREGIEGALTGVRRFAQRSPGSFLLASAGAGFAVGRLLRHADHPQQVDEEQPTQDSSDDEIDLTEQARRDERLSSDQKDFAEASVRP